VIAGARVAQAKENGIIGNPQAFEKELAEVLIDNPELRYIGGMHPLSARYLARHQCPHQTGSVG
jgi:hypothetical protein